MPEKLRRGIEVRVQELQVKAEQYYGIIIQPTIVYAARGTTAGYAVFDDNTLDFNVTLAQENEAIFVDQIVGHEFAHLVANAVYEHRGHGSEWKEVMIEFDLNPDSHHHFDVSSVIRKPKSYPYACGCNAYHFNKLTHHRMQSGVFKCNSCNGIVTYTGAAKDLLRFQNGSREHALMSMLKDYKMLDIPMKDQITLLMDFFKLSESTAKNYYYEYRPQE